ncbi:MAG: hypothetical protein ABSH08_11255 [Tepidisphaeraceae bacterium]
MNTTLHQMSPTSWPGHKRIALLRIMAGMLAIGATFWAIFIGYLVIYDWPQALLWFGPCYVVTAAYYWRALGHPSRNWCRAIWGLSLLVQGAWLTTLIVYTFRGRVDDDRFTWIITVWWAGSAVLSFIALLLDPGRAAAK